MLKAILLFFKAKPIFGGIATFAALAILGAAGYAGWRIHALGSELAAQQKLIEQKDGELEAKRQKLALKEVMLAVRDSEIETAKQKISAQNQAIESIALDMKKIRQSQAGIRKELQAKYESMEPPPKDSGCDAKLKYYEQVFKGLGK